MDRLAAAAIVILAAMVAGGILRLLWPRIFRQRRRIGGPITFQPGRAGLPGSHKLYRGLVLLFMVLPMALMPIVPTTFFWISSVLALFLLLPCLMLAIVATSVGIDFWHVLMSCYYLWLLGSCYVLLKYWLTGEERWVNLMRGNLLYSMLVLWLGEFSLYEQSRQYIGDTTMLGRIAILMSGLILSTLQALIVFRPVEHQVYAAPDPGEFHDPSPEPLDLDDQTGYCEHCERLSPSRDGQCVTCGSVVHGL